MPIWLLLLCPLWPLRAHSVVDERGGISLEVSARQISLDTLHALAWGRSEAGASMTRCVFFI
jgi:hypothetical protein